MADDIKIEGFELPKIDKERLRKKLAEPENRAKIEEINRKLVNILKEAGVDITKDDKKED